MNETRTKISGAYIRYYRERKGLTQETLANIVGVSQQSIQKWEQGEIPKRWRHYGAVCETLGIEQSDLLTIDAKMLHDWLTLKFKEALLTDDSLQMSRLSREVLQWERFFSTGSFFMDEADDDEVANSSEIERAIAIMFQKPVRDD